MSEWQHDNHIREEIAVHVALKHFWMSGSWGPPPVLQWKVLRDVTVGWKEFKPPDWETFRP